MINISEGKLTFIFLDNWKVNKYDESKFFRNHIEKCQGTKGVDILALSNNELFLIEIKDFRGYRIENKKRFNSGDLLIEVMQKVRDTLTGLYAACRWQAEEFKAFSDYIYNHSKCSIELTHKRKITVILFLEQDYSSHPLQRFENSYRDLEKTLKKSIKIFECKLFCSQ